MAWEYEAWTTDPRCLFPRLQLPRAVRKGEEREPVNPGRRSDPDQMVRAVAVESTRARARTWDPVIKNHLLCRLSYAGEGEEPTTGPCPDKRRLTLRQGCYARREDEGSRTPGLQSHNLAL